MSAQLVVRLLTTILILVCLGPLLEPAWAQDPTQMTLKGGFTVSHTATGPCMVCVPPSSSGPIELVVNFETGSVSGTVSGVGSGEATTTLCDQNGQPTGSRATAKGTASYSGAIHSGSVDPQSGAITAKATIRGSSSVEWVSGCPGCPTQQGPFTREVTISGVVNRKDGSAGGQIGWGAQCTASGDWDAQATATIYPPTATPTQEPTETPTLEPTETPLPEPTEALPPEPAATTALTPTREPEGVVPASADDDGDGIHNDRDDCPKDYAETEDGCPAVPVTPEETGLVRLLEEAVGGRPSTGDLARDLENLLAGRAVEAPTPAQAAAAGGITAALLAGWMLNQLLSGASREELIEAISRVRAGGRLADAPTKPVPRSRKAPIEVQEKKPSTVLDKQQIEDMVAWGIKHNRRPEQIMEDLNSLDRQHGGSGDLKLDDPLVSVETEDGRATATETEAKLYQDSKKYLERLPRYSKYLGAHFRRVTREIDKQMLAEDAVVTRGYTGLLQLKGIHNRYEAAIGRIEEKYSRPRLGDYPDSIAWEQALDNWSATPEARGHISDAQMQERQEALEQRARDIEQFKREARQFSGQDLGKPGGKTILTQPALEIHELETERDIYLSELKHCQRMKHESLGHIKQLEERARRGNR